MQYEHINTDDIITVPNHISSSQNKKSQFSQKRQNVQTLSLQSYVTIRPILISQTALLTGACRLIIGFSIPFYRKSPIFRAHADSPKPKREHCVQSNKTSKIMQKHMIKNWLKSTIYCKYLTIKNIFLSNT